MTTIVVCLIVLVFAGVLVYALTVGNVKARFKLLGVDFSLETRDRRR